jgi:hypothetical protein
VAANKLVSSTLAQNPLIVERVSSGRLGGAVVIGEFGGSPTGYEAYATSPRSPIYFGTTTQVTVVFSYHPNYPSNIFILTAYPSNPR